MFINNLNGIALVLKIIVIDLNLPEIQPALDFGPEALSQDKQTKIKQDLTNNYQAGGDSCYLHFRKSKPRDDKNGNE